MPILLIILSIFCSALAQVVMKIAVEQLKNNSSVQWDNLFALAWTLGTNWLVITGIILYVLSLVLWIFVLKNVEVSTAYPFIALGFVFVLLIGALFLGESVTTVKIVGISLILLGAFVLSLNVPIK